MATIQDALKAWPINRANEPIMKASEEAIFYATLIYDKPARIEEIKTLRRKTLFDLGWRRKKKNINMDHLMIIAVKGQFFRECLEEVDRLKNQTYQLNQGGE